MNWRDSPAHLLLLSKFRSVNSRTRYHDPDYWETVLGEKAVNAIDQFLTDGALEPASLQELVDYKFKASELKSILKQMRLKVSGRKEELIQRLIENDSHSMRENTKDLDLFICTTEGMQLADRYIEAEKAKRDTAERNVLELLGKRDFPKAVSIVADFEAAQVFPRGLGIDWKNFNIESGVEPLRAIFEKTPGILIGIEETRLYKLRMAAAMMELWGTNSARDWLPDNFETGIHLDSDAASRMFVFYSWQLRRLADYKGVVKTVEVSSVDDGNTCSDCRKISGKKFELETVPELPYPKCTSELGCRCLTVADEFK